MAPLTAFYIEIVTTIQQAKSQLLTAKKAGRSIGLVPTMGALHQGHISLIKASRSENSLTIATIFVNPIQFNRPEDLEKYPRSPQADTSMLEEAGCDILFMPEAKEIYPSSPEITLDFGRLEKVMEGAFRPGHFSGVGIIVSKLFNIVRPDRAYFGQKDLQQFAVIDKLNTELNFGIELRRMPIIREPGGLALSSRNRRLSPEGAKKATLIFRALMEASELLRAGHSIISVKDKVNDLFASSSLTLEYFEVVEAKGLTTVTEVKPGTEYALCIAAWLEEIRLIDNTLLTL